MASPSGRGASGAKVEGSLRDNVTTIVTFRGNRFEEIKALAELLLYLLGRFITPKG